MNHEVGATIRLWRAPSRVWPAFPTVAVIRAVRGQRTASDGVSVFLDGSKVGVIAPRQLTMYRVSSGEHSLSLRYLGGLRRSGKLSVALTEGEEKQFACSLNGFAWPSIRPATPKDVAAMEQW